VILNSEKVRFFTFFIISDDARKKDNTFVAKFRTKDKNGIELASCQHFKVWHNQRNEKHTEFDFTQACLLGGKATTFRTILTLVAGFISWKIRRTFLHKTKMEPQRICETKTLQHEENMRSRLKACL